MGPRICSCEMAVPGLTLVSWGEKHRDKTWEAVAEREPQYVKSPLLVGVRLPADSLPAFHLASFRTERDAALSGPAAEVSTLQEMGDEALVSYTSALTDLVGTDPALTEPPGRRKFAQQVDPASGSTTYTIGVLLSRIWGFLFLLDLPEGLDYAAKGCAPTAAPLCTGSRVGRGRASSLTEGRAEALLPSLTFETDLNYGPIF